MRISVVIRCKSWPLKVIDSKVGVTRYCESRSKGYLQRREPGALLPKAVCESVKCIQLP
jgi:hypothetical protein